MYGKYAIEKQLCSSWEGEWGKTTPRLLKKVTAFINNRENIIDQI